MLNFIWWKILSKTLYRKKLDFLDVRMKNKICSVSSKWVEKKLFISKINIQIFLLKYCWLHFTSGSSYIIQCLEFSAKIKIESAFTFFKAQMLLTSLLIDNAWWELNEKVNKLKSFYQMYSEIQFSCSSIHENLFIALKKINILTPLQFLSQGISCEMRATCFWVKIIMDHKQASFKEIVTSISIQIFSCNYVP